MLIIKHYHLIEKKIGKDKENIKQKGQIKNNQRTYLNNYTS